MGTIDYKGGDVCGTITYGSNRATCNTESLTINGSEGLPISLGSNIDVFYLDIDNITSDIDLTGWQPTGLNDCAEIRIRKIGGNRRILFADNVLSYDFVSRSGEFFVLKYDKENNKLNII